MTLEEAKEILEKDIRCDKEDGDTCDLYTGCSGCPHFIPYEAQKEAREIIFSFMKEMFELAGME